MTPDRLQQIEELFNSVREAPSAERAGLLAQADPEVRREVESLLLRQKACLILDRSAEALEDPTITELKSGARLGPYQVEGKLGEGGMGEVFRAIDTRLGRAVAIKVTRGQFSDRFEREAHAISSLNHPNICTLFDVGPNYLVMELVEGETIAQRLKQGPIPVEMACRHGLQIAAALVEAHSKGIVHRDLKPGNVMIAKSGVKVLDFGLAKSGQDETVTGSHMVIGTPAYMAPEQRDAKPADARADIYSIGCVLYEMVTGKRFGAQRERIRPRRLEKIVNRCLEEDPARRWQSAAELERELGKVVATPWIAVAAAAVLLALIGAGYFYFRQPARLTDKDTIVLADFVNNTGDPIFDGTLRQGLAIQLEQSPFLRIMDDDQVRRSLRLMSLPPGTRITNETAREICTRQGATVTIDGAIASLGKNYVVTLQAVACQDGATLAREQVEADDKEHVLNSVGTAAAAMRGKLGESLNSIQRLNRPLADATTPSLEALQNYTAGKSQISQGNALAAAPLFERATKLDPNFAVAYQGLGVAYEVAGDTLRSAEYAKKAFLLADRTSEFERIDITAYYYRATGEVDKEIDAWQALARSYPRYKGPHNQLGLVYVDLGRYEEGLKEGLEAARMQPDWEAPYRRQLDADICLDRLPDARELAGKLRSQRIDTPRIHQRYLEMAYAGDDPEAVSKEIQWFAGKPEDYLSLGLQAADRNVHGQRRESHKLYRRAAEMAQRRGLPDVASEFDEADARADAFNGNCETTRRLERPAVALAICGNEAGAEKLAAETSKLLPNGTIWNEVQLPEIRAASALYRNQPARSVELLASASPYERSYIDASYFRGLAYLRLQKGPEAVAEFRKILDHKGASWGATWVHPNWGLFYSLSSLGMARGFALAGDTAKAKKAFQDFFELWKNADPDIPVLKEAKTQYAKLL
jgi:eukaryotic-like serine/threonine-protein kinase